MSGAGWGREIGIDADGNLIVPGDIILAGGITIGDDLNVDGDTTLNGDVTLGDVSGDIITLRGTRLDGRTSGRFRIANVVANITVPVFLPIAAAPNSGLGGTTNQPALIANNLHAVQAVEDGGNAALHFPEISTPTPVADHGSIYYKADGKIYVQDSAGNERELLIADAFFGEMYMKDATQTVTIDTTDVYHLVLGFSTGDVDGFTFNAGREVDANIDAEGDATQLQVVTSGAHNLITGDVVSLSNMNNAGHNGITVITVVNGTSFTCDDIAYVGNVGASAGRVVEGSYLEVSVGSAGEYHISFSLSGESVGNGKLFRWEIFNNSSEASNILTERNHANTDRGSMGTSGILVVADGDRIFLGCQNTTDDTDFTLDHANVNLHRI